MLKLVTELIYEEWAKLDVAFELAQLCERVHWVREEERPEGYFGRLHLTVHEEDEQAVRELCGLLEDLQIEEVN